MRLNGTHLVFGEPRSARDVSLQIAWTGMEFAARTSNASRASTHSSVELIIDVSATDGRAEIEAWLDRNNSQKTIFSRESIECRICRAEGFVHIDITDENLRLLAVTLTDESNPQLVYAQSSLLCGNDFCAGMFDRPTLRDAVIHEPEIVVQTALPIRA